MDIRRETARFKNTYNVKFCLRYFGHRRFVTCFAKLAGIWIRDQRVRGHAGIHLAARSQDSGGPSCAWTVLEDCHNRVVQSEVVNGRFECFASEHTSLKV